MVGRRYLNWKIDLICINVLNKLGAKVHKFPPIKSLKTEVIIVSLSK